jgi:hypothetical protein
MTNGNRSIIDPQGAPAPVPGGPRVGFLRALIWLVLVVSAVGNSVSSFGGVSMAVHLGFGLVTAICVVALVAPYLRGRR